MCNRQRLPGKGETMLYMRGRCAIDNVYQAKVKQCSLYERKMCNRKRLPGQGETMQFI